MADQREGGIVWTDESWNPLRGCTRVSDGCKNCYAESMAARFCGEGMPYEGTIDPMTKRWNGVVNMVPEHLHDPLRWKRPRKVFVNSMSDLFHENVPDSFIDQVFAVMALAPQHTFQVLTKRPERMLEYLTTPNNNGLPSVRIGLAALEMCLRNKSANPKSTLGKGCLIQGSDINPGAPEMWPLPNVWLGCTAENQKTADERIPLLLLTPAAVRWVSMEPLLGQVDLDKVYLSTEHAIWLDWVVVGGESGPNARPMHPDWPRKLRDQCAGAGVPFLFKQWGEWAPDCLCGKPTACTDTPRPEPGKMGCMFRCGKKAAGRLLDGQIHDGYPNGRTRL
jgi:protein gp37